MTKVARILLSVIVVAIVWPAKISVAQAISITKGSHEFEPLETAPNGGGIAHYRTRIIGLDNRAEGLPRDVQAAHCNLNPENCVGFTAVDMGNTPGIRTAHSAVNSMRTTAEDPTESSETTALLLLIVGVIGLSRLRGRPTR